MDIIVKAKNCEVPARVKDEAVEKLNHAMRFFDRLQGIELLFAEEANPRIAEPASVEVTARTKGQHIRAQGSGVDHRTAVDIAVSRFERQLARYKARLVDRRRGKRSLSEPSSNGLIPTEGAPPTTPDSPADDADTRIVRTKRFALQPMLPEDAAWQAELLGHDFYVFANVATGRCNVVYRRHNGGYGLIEALDAEEASATETERSTPAT